MRDLVSIVIYASNIQEHDRKLQLFFIDTKLTIKILRVFPIICTIYFCCILPYKYWGSFLLHTLSILRVLLTFQCIFSSLKCNIIGMQYNLLPLTWREELINISGPNLWLVWRDNAHCWHSGVKWGAAALRPSQPALCGNLPQNRKNAMNKTHCKFDFEY